MLTKDQSEGSAEAMQNTHYESRPESAHLIDLLWTLSTPSWGRPAQRQLHPPAPATHSLLDLIPLKGLLVGGPADAGLPVPPPAPQQPQTQLPPAAQTRASVA